MRRTRLHPFALHDPDVVIPIEAERRLQATPPALSQDVAEFPDDGSRVLRLELTALGPATHADRLSAPTLVGPVRGV